MLIRILFIFFTVALQILGNPINQLNDKKGQYLVTNLPGLYDNIPKQDFPLMFAGQLELYKENNTHYFFWRFSDSGARGAAANRTIFWLNGGPGCSSMDGALMEAGPFRINLKKEVVYNNGSWHKAANMIFVDQPAGTGYSYSNNAFDVELYQVKTDFLVFLLKYFEIFPEDMNKEIFLAGESYAGQYIPYIAQGIMEYNKNPVHESKINLKGLLIGNGWISPNEQSLSYLPYSVAAGIISPSNPNWSLLLAQQEKCQNVLNNIGNGDYLSQLQIASATCEKILSMILSATLDQDAPKDSQCINMYDFTLRDSYPSCGMNWPPDLADVTPFLGQERVMDNLNLIEHKEWHECSGTVGRYLSARHSRPSVELLPAILEEIPILLFNGNRDIICNYIGTENFIKEMKWNGEIGFSQDLSEVTWLHDGQTAGYLKSERNLTFVNVFNSSHMVPFDKPEVSRSLIDLLVGDYVIQERSHGEDREKVALTTSKRKSQLSDPNSDKGKSGASKTEDSTKGTVAPETQQESQAHTNTDSDSDSNSDSESQDSKENNLITGTRILQFAILIVVLWGFYVLLSSYRSGPSSIIKSKPSNKKKNVQWADQLRQFETEEMKKNEQGILSRAFLKFKRNDKNIYAPIDGKGYENIELQPASEGRNVEEEHLQNPGMDAFRIGDEDEERT